MGNGMERFLMGFPLRSVRIEIPDEDMEEDACNVDVSCETNVPHFCTTCAYGCAECMDNDDEQEEREKDNPPEAQVPCLKLTVPAGYVLRRNSDASNDWKVVRDPDRDPLKPARVIFSKPATVVLWTDGTRTVVKCDKKDHYSKATGLALCFMKKALGNTSRGLNEALRDANECSVVESKDDRRPTRNTIYRSDAIMEHKK